jgi:GTP-binding protein Era
MNQEAREGARDADVVIFVTDAAPKMTTSMRDVDRAILRTIGEGKPVILVLNKVDKITNKADLLPVLEGYAKERDFSTIVPLSAFRRDAGVRAMLGVVAELLPEGPPLFDADEITDKPVRFFVSEFVREQILKHTYEEVPHGVAVVVERFEEGGRVAHIDLAVHVDRDSHKGIVLGAKGLLMKEIASAARQRVEALIGRQVNLRIWVRVSPKWYEKDSALKDFGYEPADAGGETDIEIPKEEASS